MNNQEKHDEDPLRQYINPERIEKAPEGFTSEVMTRIQVEAIPPRPDIRFLKTERIPLISVGIALLLTFAAFLIPDKEAGYLALPVVNIIKNLRLFLPEVNLTYLNSLRFPAIFLYVMGGILTLALFDRALNLFFHRER